MERNKTAKQIGINALKPGVAGVGLSMLLLLPIAALLYGGKGNMNGANWMALGAAVSGTVLAQVLFGVRKKGRGAVIQWAVSECTCMLMFGLVAAGIPEYRFETDSMLPLLIATSIGNALGLLIEFNKMYNKKAAKKRRVYKK